MKEIRHMKEVVRGMNKPLPPKEGGWKLLKFIFLYSGRGLIF